MHTEAIESRLDDARDVESRKPAVIRTVRLTRIFSMGDAVIRALDSVNLEIPRGEFCAIMGPSGSGKTTLMNMGGCLDSVDSGEYWLNGSLVSDLSQRELAQIRNREIGFIFQTFNLLNNATAQQNVEMPLIYSGLDRRERRKRAISALERVGLSDRVWHKPGELSGGQRQRVAIARALVTEPSLVLADEPTGNLDSATAAEILGLFRSLHETGNTIVLVTHDPSVAGNAERVIKMLDGQIVSDSKGN